MTTDLTPSTHWQERVAADEDERYARYGQQFAAIQSRKSKKYGNGRALHRKQLTAAKGTLEILADLPEFACHGLFAKPAAFETWVRLSNGGLDLFARYGVLGAPVRLASMVKTVGKSFGGFATETMFSAAPIACGPYAVRVRMVPAESNGPASADAKQDWGADFSANSAQGQDLAQKVEAAIFDPWQALAAHRSLGDVIRARKVVYFVSQQARGAA